MNGVAATTCNQLMQPARLFNLLNDVIVSIGQPNGCSSSNIAIHVTDPSNAANNSDSSISLDPSGIQIATRDFNGDGFDELVVVSGQYLVLYSAIDTAAPSKGVKELARLSVQAGNQSMPVTGDLNGDGTSEIALVARSNSGGYSYYSASFVSVCPAAGVVVLDETCSSVFQLIQVKTAIPLASTNENGPFLVDSVPRLIAGNFKGISTQVQLISDAQLADPDGSNFWHQLDGWDFNTDFTLEHHSSFRITSSAIPDAGFWAAAPLDSFSLSQELVYINFSSLALWVFTFDSALNMTPHTTRVNNSGPCVVPAGLSVGRYDPPDPNSNSKDFSLQIAVLFTCCVSKPPQSTLVTLYTVNAPNDFTPNEHSTTVIANQWPVGIPTDQFGNVTSPNINLLHASDTQGRSTLLGPPTKIIIENVTTPSIVIASPPMHVDFVSAAGKNTPTLLNLSFDPDGFNTIYQTEDSSGTKSSSKNGLSWTFSAKENFGTSVGFGNLNQGEGGQLSITQKAAQDLKGNVETEHGSYSKRNINVSQETGVADQVWYTDSRFNIYAYPVIGKTVCPASKPNCQESEKVPLVIQYSAPDQTSNDTISGDTVEWYQPPWEYGNIFSYPGSYSQNLEAFLTPQITPIRLRLTYLGK